MAWASGHLGMASWSAIASELQLTLLVPRAARGELELTRPGDAELVEVLLAQPTVVVLNEPEATTRNGIAAVHAEAGTFDPVAAWVVRLCRARGWPALTSDPARLRRLDPSLEVDLL